ncbi:Asp-tRNA(Asn)/Glu-tRNA(Gln) amidotransferase subunit GatB [Candidatus Microgenomates bacterium]|nr:MAG: Asp-tRNA(Asn)/Glu-tRNA(Gln) amidotransferase subunit GatB [Candidatus Microgenomates bacterium]
MDTYTPIIGMEIHVELKTNSKMFCGCKNDPFHAEKPNIYTCPVCLGLPGALPVPNRKAIEWTIKLGYALGCEIALFSKFDRKNYFYPDLAKGYQISQYDQPFCGNGKVSTSFGDVGITRVHLEEDTGKLMHATVDGERVSLIDFNRSGVPLIEIVTEPDIHSSEAAREFLKKLHQIVRFLDISDAEMEKGSMRLEPNISVAVKPSLRGRKDEAIPNEIAALPEVARNDTLPDYKVEVKNINSFNFVKKAIDYEVKRHIEILEKGETPTQETRGWDEKKNITVSQRKKEAAHDYRYFPEPDIPPIRWTNDQLLTIQKQIPELPDAKVARFTKDYALTEQDAKRLTETRELADYFEKVLTLDNERLKIKEVSPKDIANWILNKKINIDAIRPEEVLQQIKKAKTKVTLDPDLLQKIINEVIAEHAKAVADYKSGKTGVIMFLVGMAMKKLKGKADAKQIKTELEKKII